MPYLVVLDVFFVSFDENVHLLRLVHSALNVQAFHLVDTWMIGWMDDFYPDDSWPGRVLNGHCILMLIQKLFLN